MKTIKFLTLILFLGLSTLLKSQVETTWIDTTTNPSKENVFFFTNRPLIERKDGSKDFKNKFTRQTDNLYFCLFNYEEDSIYIKYSARNTSKSYPADRVEENIIYKIYKDLHEKKGIKRFIVVIPGYSKTFEKQVHDYVFRLHKIYGDTLKARSLIVTYAWGNEWRPEFYYRAKRSARRAANDYAIFQHMLEDFLTDSAFFNHQERSFKVDLLCSSMGNQLLKKYLLERTKQGIELIKIFDNISFIGSDTSWDSFEEGKGFHNIREITDSVHVFVNAKDTPLKFSQILNSKQRMGLVGPKDWEKLPKYIKIYNITDIIGKEDRAGLGHDYLLRNPVLKEALIKELIIE